MIASRRGFLFGASAFLAAPAIVRVSSLMPISVRPPLLTVPINYVDALAASMVETKAITAARVLNMNIEAFRELLLPGLRGIEAKYEDIPQQYDRIFMPAGQ